MTAGARLLLGAALLACALAQGCASAASGSASRPAGVSPPAIPEMTAADHERLGDLHTGQGSLERAYLEYREAVRLDPQSSGARYKAARILLRRGLPAEARAEFAAILEARPGDALALLGLGHALFLAGDPGAEQRLREAVAADPGLWQAHNLLGLLYDRNGVPADAVMEFLEALKLNPAEGTVANNLGVTLLRAGDPAGAEKAFRRALASGLRDAKVHNNLGLALARLGRRDEAFKAFKGGGTDAAAWNNLGFALLVAGRADEATAALEKAIAAESGYYRRAHENMKRALVARPSPEPLPRQPAD